MTSMSKPPMIVVLDNKGPRMDMLQRYVQGRESENTFAVKRGGRLIYPTPMSLPEEAKPEVFRGWYLWGAPLIILGQSSWYPRLKEHKHIGWMVAIHSLRAVERAGGTMENEPDWRRRVIKESATVASKYGRLPQLVISLLDNSGSVTLLMHGVPIKME